jgi:hypothetical protein
MVLGLPWLHDEQDFVEFGGKPPHKHHELNIKQQLQCITL